jgi:ERF superfamily protein
MDGQTKRELATVPEDRNDPLMTVVAELARSGNIEAVKEMVKLRNDELARVAKLSYMADFVRMKPHLKKIENKHYNSQTKSKYAKLEDINQEVDPVLEQYGFATSTNIVSQTETGVTVKAILIHKDGHSEETQIFMPLDKTGLAGTVNKTNPHALTSSIKYARRVAVCAILNISTGDGIDKDGNGEPETPCITTEQAADLDTRSRALGDDYHKRFLTWLGAGTAIEIKASDYKKAITGLEKAEKEAQKTTTTNSKGK